MPGHGKQEADDRFSGAYKALLLKREALLKQRSKLLGKKTFNQLNEKDQLQYCGLNKKLMENYWLGFETAQADEDFESSAKDFLKAREMGYSKANTLFAEIKPNTPLKKKASFYKNSGHNLIKGLGFHLGLGCPQNQEEAARFYKKAAKQGYAQAQCNLGTCYYNGIGVKEDEEAAVRWYRLAAEQGHALAQYNLGVCYDNGTGVKENEEAAAHWYRLAAEQGFAQAQYNLGVCYDTGAGVKEDKVAAVHWYRLAAEQGYASAQNNLGFNYKNGIVVKEDKEAAVHWYRLAAEQGNTTSLRNLKTLTTPPGSLHGYPSRKRPRKAHRARIKQ